MRGVSRELFMGEELRCVKRIFPLEQNLENGLRPVAAAPALISYYYKGKYNSQKTCVLSVEVLWFEKDVDDCGQRRCRETTVWTQDWVGGAAVAPRLIDTPGLTAVAIAPTL
jgi:hypothetical protein